jgi:hypothetical protein
MWVEIHSPTRTPFRRPLGGSRQIHEAPPTTDLGSSDCHLWRVTHIAHSNWSLFKFQTSLLFPMILMNQPICPLDISLMVNHWPNYLPLTTQQSRVTGLPGGNHFNSSCKPFGTDGHPTTCTSYKQRQRWSRSSPNLQPGDVVLIRKDNTTPLQWPTAIIKAVHPGACNQTRVFTIKTPKGGTQMPI